MGRRLSDKPNTYGIDAFLHLKPLHLVLAEQLTFIHFLHSDISETPHGKAGNYEVYFPSDYVHYHPWGDTPHEDTILPLEVKKLCHVTHDTQASQIRNFKDDCYHFKPREKFGKPQIEDRVDIENNESYHSYRCTLGRGQVPKDSTRCYQLIPDTKQVFHGYFSWWGLAMNRKSPPNPSGITVPKGNLPGYLKNPPQSFYGKNAFVSSFQNLLESYRTSRQCQTIYLRMGGTLRYKCEIGYVVIVCTSYDYDVLHNYDPLTHDVLDTTGLTNEDGKIINRDVTPYFTTQCIDASSSYETLNFALYFQDNKNSLMCHTKTLEEIEVNHECPCLHKQPIRYFYDPDSDKFKYYEKCPDKITQEDYDRHEEITSFCEDY